MIKTEDQSTESIDNYIATSTRYSDLSEEQKEIINTIRKSITLQELIYICENNE